MSGLIPSDNSVYSPEPTLFSAASTHASPGSFLGEPSSQVMSPEFTASAMIVYTTGEGMVVELTDLGRVWTQSRNPNGLIGWLTTVLPFTRA